MDARIDVTWFPEPRAGSPLWLSGEDPATPGEALGHPVRQIRARV
ncbi:hypothetical protein [Streptomyces lacrimifluminis]|nr:hypothetical protein [Streptomyces lacrimifluminis]